MARFIPIFITLLFLAVLSLGAPLPYDKRQIGDLACNISRLKIVAAVAKATKSVGAIDTSDPTSASAATAAQSGLSQASAGIKTIAAALFTGQAAPADARTQVGDGLTAAQTALAGISNSTDPAVASAQSEVQDAITDGDDVVSECN